MKFLGTPGTAEKFLGTSSTPGTHDTPEKFLGTPGTLEKFLGIPGTTAVRALR